MTKIQSFFRSSWIYLTEPRTVEIDGAIREYLTRILHVAITLLLLLTDLILIFAVRDELVPIDWIILGATTLIILSSHALVLAGHWKVSRVFIPSGLMIVSSGILLSGLYPVTGTLLGIIALLISGLVLNQYWTFVIIIAFVYSIVQPLKSIAADQWLFSVAQGLVYLSLVSAISLIQWLAMRQLHRTLDKTILYNLELQRAHAERQKLENQVATNLMDYQITLQHVFNNVFRLRKREDGTIYFEMSEGSLARRIGLTTENVYGRSLNEILGNESAHTIESYYQRAFDGEVVAYDVEHEDVHFTTMLTPIVQDGKVVEVVGSSVDITEKKVVEHELLQVNQRMNIISKQTSLIIIEMDSNLIIREWNKAAELTFGWDRDEVLGRDEVEITVPPDQQEHVRKRILEAFQSGNPSISTNENITRDGKRILIEWINNPVRNEEGNIVGSLTFGFDVTEKERGKRLEKALYDISEAASRSENLTELYESVHDLTNGLVPAKNFYIGLYDPHEDLIRYPYHVDEFDAHPVSRKPAKGLTEYVIRTGQAILVDPTEFYNLVDAGEAENVGTPSVDWLGVPLKTVDHHTFGTIVVQTYTEGERYTEEHKQIIEFVSAQISNAILRKQAEEEIRLSEDRFRGFVEQTTDGVMLLNEDGEIVEMNNSLEEQTGFARSEVLGKKGWDFIYQLMPHFEADGSSYENIKQRYMGLLKTGEAGFSNQLFEVPLIRKNGTIRYSQQSVFTIRTPSGFMVGAISRDVTEQRRIQEALRESENRFRSMIENQGEGTGFVDTDEVFIYVNPAAEVIFGVPQGSLVGRKVTEFLTQEEIGKIAEQSSLRRGGERTTYELNIMAGDGSNRTLLITASPQIDSHDVFLGTFAVFRDITDRKRTEDRLRYYSMHDALTGVYNRAYFDTELLRLQGSREYPISLMVVDLDDLKKTNDKFGHAAGDEVLKQAARLLVNNFRTEDIVARIGGDEFAVLLPRADAAVVAQCMERVQKQVTALSNRGGMYSLSLSCGCATGSDGADLKILLEEADGRMFAEKSEKKHQFLRYHDSGKDTRVDKEVDHSTGSPQQGGDSV